MPRSFRLYDTLTRTVKELQPIEPNHLRFYSCGPTVYSYAHIGNFRTFLTADLIVRTAEAIGWKVSYVTNITDVGHLTQDDIADAEGEDRMEKALKSKEGERFHNVWELAEYYADQLKDDWKALNLREPMVRPKATQHMTDQIKAVEKLIDMGHAYETPTGVYFDVASFEGYGKLSGNKQEDLKRGVRDIVEDENKRHPADFALWKKDPKHLMQWYSPFGWGFPGWHIECSVMARDYLGDTIDLHAGGEDLIFPHHECEIAQSETLTGKPFSQHWVHTRFLQVNGEKMAKRLGNFYTVRDLLAKGADPLAIRYALISGVYGKPLNFTDQSLIDATRNVQRFRDAEGIIANASVDGEDKLGPALQDVYGEALEAMLNDLNTAVALAKALEGTKLITREGDQISRASAISGAEFLEKMNQLLGVIHHENEWGEQAVVALPEPVDTGRIDALIAERAEAKKSKNFGRADEIREELDEMGVELRDTPDGTVWVRKSV